MFMLDLIGVFPGSVVVVWSGQVWSGQRG